MSTREGQIFQFGKFQIDASARSLQRGDAIIKLNSRAFDVLLYLVQNPGKVLTRDELLKNVWPDAFVDEHSLAQSISVLRRALEEKPGDNTYIVTLPGRGYQFASAVRAVAHEDGNTLPEVATVGPTDPGGIVFQKHTVETSFITTRQEKEQLSSPITRSRHLIGTIATVLAAVVGVALMVLFRAPRHLQPNHELVGRQLTANSPGDPVRNAVISRDGKYLAYSSFLSKKMRILEIDSGDLRDLPSPEAPDPLDWYPDGSHLVVQRQRHPGLWKVSVWDGTYRKLVDDDVDDAVISPDGSHIAFANPQGEIWLIGGDGEDPRRILAPDKGEILDHVAWSPHGQRLVFIRRRGDYYNQREVSIETCDLQGGKCTLILLSPNLWGPQGTSALAWLPDGRIVYSVFNAPPAENYAIWTVPVDADAGTRRGAPTALTHQEKENAESFRFSSNGKRLLYVAGFWRDTVYLHDLRSPDKKRSSQRLTLDDWYNYPRDWSRDSRAILLESLREGRRVILKQNIGDQVPDVLVSGGENYSWPALSPTGEHLLFTVSTTPGLGDQSKRLMTMPVEGGSRSLLLTGAYRCHCGYLTSANCVIAEANGKQLVFSFLDPVHGKGTEIQRIDVKALFADWSLSPDGTRIAIGDPSSGGWIQILTIADGKLASLPHSGTWAGVQHVAWAADGKHLFATAWSNEVPGQYEAILSLDLQGHVEVIEVAGAGWLQDLRASPDGHYLAYTKRNPENNVMLLENSEPSAAASPNFDNTGTRQF
jgi:DNA-binding winged helix-turn-helix (wHTH) protein/Tol biopolymer transport system component